MVTDSPALAFVLRGPQHTVEIMNPSFLALVDKHLDDVVGQRFAEALPEQAARYLATFDQVFTTGEPVAGHEIVAQAVTDDGERVERYFNFVLVPLRGPSGTIEGIMNFGFEVTEQRTARQKSLDLERRYRFALDALPTLAWTTNGRSVDYVNRRWAEYSGHQVRDPSTVDWSKFVHPDDLHVMPTFENDSVEPWTAEYRLRRHDGVYRWFLGRSVAFLDGDGHTTRRFGTATEIHEQKEAESRQRALASVTAHIADAQSPSDVARVACSEGRVALEACSAAMWMREADGTLQLLASDGVVTKGIPPGTRVQPDQAGAVRAAIEHGNGLWIDVETSCGTLIFSAVPAHPFSEPQKELVRTLTTYVTQAHERARALEAERRASARVALLATSGEILSASLDFRETLRNLSRVVVPAFADWCAIDLVLEGEIERVAVHHSDPEQVKRAFDFARRYPDRRGDGSSTNRVIDNKETVWVPHVTDAMLAEGARDVEHYDALSELGIASVIQVPLVVDGRAIGVATFVNDESRPYDETDRTFAEELGRRAALAIANALLFTREHDAARRAEEANRIKDEFLATVGHELRTPLNAIMGWSSMLLGDAQRRVSLEKGLDVIHRNAVSQARIINDILDVSRIVTGKLKIGAKPVDLVTVVHEAIDVVKPSADAKGIVITVDASDPSVTIVGDPERLRQVAWNLLSNAVKFTSTSGNVRVVVQRDESGATICVEDDGHGIAPEFLPVVFERFRQADSSSTRQHGGLGLGLAIVRHIVELHGGTCSAASPGVGCGATFRVALPVRAVFPPRCESDEPNGVPRSVTPLRRVGRSIVGRRVLVVDDDQDARDLIEAVLVDAGAFACAASSVKEGLVALAEFKPDVVVSDIGMPGDDGYAFIHRIRALPRAAGGAVAAVALTAYARAEDRVRLLAAGFDNHVAKPVDADELLDVIADLCVMP